MLDPISWLILKLLDLYSWIVIAAVVVSWLVAFNVINTYNRYAAMLVRVLYVLTEPVFRQVRRVIPSIGGMDFSPFIVLLAIWFLEYVVVWLNARFAF
jgi:YggT family protein